MSWKCIYSKIVSPQIGISTRHAPITKIIEFAWHNYNMSNELACKISLKTVNKTITWELMIKEALARTVILHRHSLPSPQPSLLS
uniref:Uncharacterized protein n=1 Tax=Arundo donax TaxID=35708 RepID=A0A0A9EBW6_ARUDO